VALPKDGHVAPEAVVARPQLRERPVVETHDVNFFFFFFCFFCNSFTAAFNHFFFSRLFFFALIWLKLLLLLLLAFELLRSPWAEALA